MFYNFSVDYEFLARSSPDEGKGQNQEIVDKILIFVSSKLWQNLPAKPLDEWKISDYIRMLDGNIVPCS